MKKSFVLSAVAYATDGRGGTAEGTVIAVVSCATAAGATILLGLVEGPDAPHAASKLFGGRRAVSLRFNDASLERLNRRIEIEAGVLERLRNRDLCLVLGEAPSFA